MNSTLISHWFSNPPATPEQRALYERLWEQSRILALVFNELIPEGADKTAAIRHLRTSVTAAITAIACHVDSMPSTNTLPPPLLTDIP